MDASAGVLSTAQRVDVLDNDVRIVDSAATERALVFADGADGKWQLKCDRTTANQFLEIGDPTASVRTKQYTDMVTIGNVPRTMGSGMLRVGGAGWFQAGVTANAVTAQPGQVLTLAGDAGVRVSGDLVVTGHMSAVNESVLQSSDKQIFLAQKVENWEGTVLRDAAHDDEIALDFYGTRYSASNDNLNTMYVQKGIKYTLKLSD